MFARFIRYMVWPDTVYLNKPIPALGPHKATPIGKIYCEKCKWLVSAPSGHSCHHESNKIISDPKNKWLSPNPFFSLREHPKQKNRRNDCSHFEISHV